MTALPAGRFYWGLLDASGFPRRVFARGPSRRQLGYLLEPLLPVPLEGVHAVYRRLPDGRFLACAADEALLREALAAGEQSLAPEALPPFLSGIGGSASGLNMLTGCFETPRRRAHRRACTLVTCGGVALIAALLFIGLERRVAVARLEQRQAQAAADAVLARVFSTPSAQSGELRLVAELRRLRDFRPRSAAPPDASESLASVLSHWPTAFDGRVESLIIAPAGISAAVLVGDHGRAEQLAAAFSSLPGWSSEQPRIRADGAGVRVTIRLTRPAEPSP